MLPFYRPALRPIYDVFICEFPTPIHTLIKYAICVFTTHFVRVLFFVFFCKAIIEKIVFIITVLR